MADEEIAGKPAEPKTPGETKTPEEGELGGAGDGMRVKGKDGFYIDLTPKFVEMPSLDDKKSINIRYPLMEPYAYAHIYWDDNNNELMYEIEEPKLSSTEKELLGLIQLGLEEMINISFVRAAKSNLVLDYLEKNVQNILLELGTKVSKETYNKIMYFVYRDAVGLNMIEPLLNDYYIEDIECNGTGFPLYIVHRRYENLRTNVIFEEKNDLVNFVEKLAQKAGRYISYAKPLLDGTLPDGSRVNATYTEDITTRGPTFTIRKFTKEPWTPVHLMEFKTASADLFAFLWMTMQYKFNVMVVGETASGKTTFLNTVAQFIQPEARIVSIEDTRELNLAHSNWLPSVTRLGFGIPTISGMQYGEVTLFDLLRETFRQNPDYVILGETRGKETYVLFQGMASGHPSLSTFHAASVETLVKRLETPPIELPPSLIETLDVICVATHVKSAEKNVRRIKNIAEIESVEQALGKVNYHNIFEWDPIKDEVTYKGGSLILKKISERNGVPVEKLEAELKRRSQIFKVMKEKNIKDFKEFTRIVNTYYKNPEKLLKELGIQ